MRPKLRLGFAALALSALAAACSSTPSTTTTATTTTTPTVSYDRSCEKTAESQVAMDECAGSELNALERQLSQALDKDSALFGSAGVDKVQAAWLQYRTDECVLDENAYKGGTIEPLIYGECEVTLTVQRIMAIREVIASHAGQ